MRKKIRGYLYGAIHPAWLAAVLNGLADESLNMAYFFQCLQNRRDKEQLPPVAQARQMLEEASPSPKKNRPIRSAEADPSITASVIVPVYNVEAYVKSCLDSLQGQITEYAYEVIVIDDGATDQSGKLIENYQSDPRFRIIHQSNQGLSGARNTGLELARGKYICFVDSDDFVEANYLQMLITAANENHADIVEAGYYKLYGDGHKRKVLLPQVKICKADSRRIFQYTGFFWGKLFRRELFDQIRLPEGYWYEDTIMHFLLFRMCQVFVYLPQALYAYRINEKGITKSSVGNPKAIDTYWILEYCVSMSSKLRLENDQERLYELLLYHCGYILWLRLKSLPDKIQRAAFVLAAGLIEENRPATQPALPYLYREVEKAFLQKNFAKWKLAAQYM